MASTIAVTTIVVTGSSGWRSLRRFGGPPAKRALVRVTADTNPSTAAEQRPSVGEPNHAANDHWLANLLMQLPSGLVRDPEGHRLQVLVTQLERGEPVGTFGFRVDAEYFYPASAIKPFVAVAALRELERLQRANPELDLKTPLALCRIDDDKCLITDDRSNLDSGRITLLHEIRKMLLVSNNVAFNRLYDFVGHQRLNAMFADMGLPSVRLHHRFLGGADGGRVSPPLVFGAVAVPRRVSAWPFKPAPAEGTELGSSHYDEGGTLRDGPADFRFKNYASLSDMHALLLALVAPALTGPPDLGLSPTHRRLLLDVMAEAPLDSQNPAYQGARYDVVRYKAALAGARRAFPADDLTVVSKSGRAYGFEVENACVRHEPSNRAFCVTAVVYANPNQVMNDNGYAYHLTRAFMEGLGEHLSRAWFAPGSAP
jgi:beta-lactamase class A